MNETTNKTKENFIYVRQQLHGATKPFHPPRQTKTTFKTFTDKQLDLLTHAHKEATVQKLDCVVCQVTEDNNLQL